MKQSIFTILENKALTRDVFKMVLEGDTSAITASGQFVNIQLAGKFLCRTVCEFDQLFGGRNPCLGNHGTQALAAVFFNGTV